MSSFIIEHLEEIIREWETFAGKVSPAAAALDGAGLRDHVREMLHVIANDIETSQTDGEQKLKSEGLAPALPGAETAAESHGSLRYSAGFDLTALVAEFRALRATVLRIWLKKERYADAGTAYEIARFNEAIDQALAESVSAYSEELEKARDTFLAILGHDLRSPLGAMAGVLGIMASPAEGAVRNEAIAAGRRSVASMTAMVQDLLEFTRSRLGKGIPITPAETDLETLCKAAISEVSLVYPQASFRFESSGNLVGAFDRARMHQVAANLLNNAVQHGKRGAPISLVTTGGEDTITMKVANAGVIDPILLPRLFDPLAPTANKAPAPSGSTNMGLGLLIAREIVAAHRGTIDVTSSPQAGTEFTVQVPRG